MNQYEGPVYKTKHNYARTKQLQLKLITMKNILTCLILVLALVGILGCGSKANYSNYEKLNLGMDQTNVEALLGSGSQVQNDGKEIMYWGDAPNGDWIAIIYSSDKKLVNKKWIPEGTPQGESVKWAY